MSTKSFSDEEIDIYTAQMSEIVGGGDIENDHIAADHLLCKILQEAGFYKLVRMYENMPKWFA